MKPLSVIISIQKTSESLPTTFRYGTPGEGAVFEEKTNMKQGKVYEVRVGTRRPKMSVEERRDLVP